MEDNDDAPGCSGDDASIGGAGQSDEDEHNSEDGSSDHTSSSGQCNEDAQGSPAEEANNSEEVESSDADQEANCPPSEANSKDGNPGSARCPNWSCWVDPSVLTSCLHQAPLLLLQHLHDMRPCNCLMLNILYAIVVFCVSKGGFCFVQKGQSGGRRPARSSLKASGKGLCSMNLLTQR